MLFLEGLVMKRFAYSYIVLFFVFSGFVNADITTGLVAHYEFEDNINDSTSNSSSDTLNGTATYVTGKYGKAFSFNGNGSTTTQSLYATNSNLPQGNEARTVSAWVYPTGTTYGNILSWNSSSNSSNNFFRVRRARTSDNAALEVFASGTSYVNEGDSGVIPANTWSHVALTYDGENFKMYVNGSDVTSTQAEAFSSTLDTNGDKLMIGYWEQNANEYFVGSMDEVRVYDRALSALDITELYTLPVTYTVTSTADSGAGSLREAVANASSGNVIVFDSNIAGQTINLTSTITIDKDLTIEGNAANPMVIDGGEAIRLFSLTSGTFTIKNMTLQNGNVASGGGAIQATGGTLIAHTIVFKNNTAYYGGAVHANGGATELVFDGCHFEENSAGQSGQGNWAGAAIYTDIKVTIENSSIINNTCDPGNSVIGGAIVTGGAGPAIMRNSTCSGNYSGGYAGCITIQHSSSIIENSTIVNNTAARDDGGGIWTFVNNSTVTIKNSIIQGNSAAGSGSQISGTVTSEGYNFISDSSGATITATTGDTFDSATSPQLGTLTQDSDGMTWGYPLSSGSPLIDAGSCSAIDSSTVSADQFDNNRSDGNCDIGAIEHTVTTDITTGLVAHYEFEDNINDSTSNSSSDTLNGTATYAAGKYGKAFTFGNGNNFYSINPQLPQGNDARTVSAWVNTSRSTYGNIASWNSQSSTSQLYRFRTEQNTGKLTVFFHGGHRISGDEESVPADTWTHVALTFDGTDFKFYINGSDVTSSQAESLSNPLDTNGDKLMVGYWEQNANEYFIGLMDDVRVYNRSLSSADVNALYTSDGSSTDTPPTLSPIADINTTEDFDDFNITLDASDEDNDTITYTASSSDTSIVTVSIVDEKVQLTSVADAHGVVSVEVDATANSKTATQTFDVNVTAVNDAPTDITLSTTTIAENSAIGTTVGSLSTSDIDSSSFTYTLVSGTGDSDNSAFSISGSDLKTSEVFNYEDKNSYTLRIRTTDNGNLFFEKSFTITVTDTDDILVLTDPSDINTTEDFNDFNITLDASDEDNDTINYTASSSDTSVATVSIIDGKLQVTPVADASGVITVEVNATANGQTATQTFTVNVSAVDDAPQFTQQIANQEVDEDFSAYSLAFTNHVEDIEGDPFTITATSSDTSKLDLSADNNGITFLPKADQSGVVTVDVNVTQDSNSSLTDSYSFSVTINPINDRPTITTLFEDITLVENNGTTSYDFNVSDVEGDDLNITVDSNDTSILTVTPNWNGWISQANYTDYLEFNLTTQTNAIGMVQITVKVDDDHNSSMQTFDVNVTAVNDAPTDITLSTTTIAENSAIGTTVGSLSTSDIDSSSFTYTLVSGTGDSDNSAFSISGSDLKTSEVFNYEDKNSYTLRIRTTDNGNLFFEKSFTITVTDTDDILVLTDPSDINTTEDFNDFNITLDASDEDNDTINYTASSSDTSVATVSIIDGKLQVTPVADASGVITVEVNATANGQTATQTFTVNVSAVDDAPQFTQQIANQEVDEDFSAYSLAFTNHVEDIEGDPFTITATSSDTSKLDLSADNNGITFLPKADQSGVVTVDVNVTQDSNSSLTDSYSFSVTINPINDRPTITTLFEDITLVENNGTTSYDFNVSDVEGDDLNITVDSNDTSILTVTPNWNGWISQANYTDYLEFNLTTQTNAIGMVQITVKVDDDHNSSMQTFDVNVTAVEVDCYEASSIGRIGRSGECLNQLIVDKESLKTAIANGDDVTKMFTGQITDMSELFKWNTTFNQDISGWDVSNVTNMEGIFYGATAFNQDISQWDVSKVTNMKDIFAYASVFNQPIGNWDVSNVESMYGAFYEANAFNQNISGLNVVKMTTQPPWFNNNALFATNSAYQPYWGGGN
jgi:surface protein